MSVHECEMHVLPQLDHMQHPADWMHYCSTMYAAIPLHCQRQLHLHSQLCSVQELKHLPVSLLDVTFRTSRTGQLTCHIPSSAAAAAAG
jgi:hypothetical protein